MTPAVIIERAAADGVRLALSPVGTIKATGDHRAVNRWLPIIREQKPGIVAALREAANDEPLPDPAAEARRQRVRELLAGHPAKSVLVTDLETDPKAVILTLAIRGRATFELRVPRAKFDGPLLLDLIERHGCTVH